ncbi:hypothetical protein HT136_18385 [Novosphingobium profundi]|uniref:hypothetical protein n=1 Tax=Novosphingobium profundi TaxID=1774954 RepID=UPI001BD97173|nr:hypothetical protein [Novosphingobium profundi]MBT0670339.1 hypothetical protein [Novosphingobium profundi]
MNTFMAIMSQLFWGVTIGALEAAFATVARGAIAAIGLGGAGWWVVRRRRAKRADKD